MRRPLALAATMALGLTATACGSDPAPPPSSSSSTTVTALDKDAILEVLPDEEDLSGGWDIFDGVATADPEQSTYPRSCEALRLAGSVADRYTEDRGDHARRNYLLPADGDDVNALSVAITSYRIPVPAELFEEAGRALQGCQSFTQTTAKKSTAYTAESLTGPSWGEHSFRYSQHDTAAGRTTDVLTFAVGANLVRIIHLHEERDYDPEAIELLAKITDRKLRGAA